MNRKGIILAGGTGTRLSPLSTAISKQLMPVFDKPMIYYPLCTLMSAGIKEILIITSPPHLNAFKLLLKDGNQFGINIKYAVQKEANGIAEAFIIASDFLNNSPVALILGDNLFHGEGLINQLKYACNQEFGGTVFAYAVDDPERYGVIEFNQNKQVISIEEKPRVAKSRYALTGIYFYDSKVVEKALSIKPSRRGELEITDINQIYLKEGSLKVNILGSGIAWLDTGTFESLHDAGSYIRTLENRQGKKVCCPEEIAWRNGWISDIQLKESAEIYCKSGYGQYFKRLIEEKNFNF
tara:strand:- start:833 stop:1720 length:888 start_codon:yes stop_codon:yes gene_type:complete